MRLLKRLLLAALVLAVLGAAAGYFVVFAPNTPGFEGERSVKIPPGAGFAEAVDSLKAAGVLASATTFRLLASATGWGSQIKAGHYTFERTASNYTLLDKLRKGLQTPIRLTVPPGTRPEVFARVLAREMTYPPEAVTAALSRPSFADSLGTDPTHLFGYMLPETYFVYWLTDAPEVLRKIKSQFDRFFTDEMRRKAAQHGLTTEQVVTLAAIVEWETSVADEKPRVAGVYLNRLARGMPLQADPTVQYAVMAREGQKRRLLFTDYRIAHPYNTYLFQGLPPGPITNPSPSSIRAVVDAEAHDYLYFVADGTGRHTFSRTFDEHVRAANRFRELLRQRADSTR